MPTELDVINRKIIQMQIEEAALKNEDDELSKARLAELQKELAEQRETFNAMKAKWENEKNAIGRVQQLREKIEQLNRDIEAAEQSYDLEKAAKLKYGDLPEAKKQDVYKRQDQLRQLPLDLLIDPADSIGSHRPSLQKPGRSAPCGADHAIVTP